MRRAGPAGDRRSRLRREVHRVIPAGKTHRREDSAPGNRTRENSPLRSSCAGPDRVSRRAQPPITPSTWTLQYTVERSCRTQLSLANSVDDIVPQELRVLPVDVRCIEGRAEGDLEDRPPGDEELAHTDDGEIEKHALMRPESASARSCCGHVAKALYTL